MFTSHWSVIKCYSAFNTVILELAVLIYFNTLAILEIKIILLMSYLDTWQYKATLL